MGKKVYITVIIVQFIFFSSIIYIDLHFEGEDQYVNELTERKLLLLNMEGVKKAFIMFKFYCDRSPTEDEGIEVLSSLPRNDCPKYPFSFPPVTKENILFLTSDNGTPKLSYLFKDEPYLRFPGKDKKYGTADDAFSHL